MIDRFGGMIDLPYQYFYGETGGREGKKNRTLGESLDTANEAVIHSKSFLTQSPACGLDRHAWQQR